MIGRFAPPTVDEAHETDGKERHDSRLALALLTLGRIAPAAVSVAGPIRPIGVAQFQREHTVGRA